jgi:hypothetical protein
LRIRREKKEELPEEVAAMMSIIRDIREKLAQTIQ